MKNILVFMLFFQIAFVNNLFSQSAKITVNADKMPLAELFKVIEKQSDYTFFYMDADVRNVSTSVKSNDERVDRVLARALKNTDLVYKINDKTINISRIKEEEKVAQKHTISGYIKEKETGEVMIGATVFVEDLAIGAVTNSYGFYSIEVPEGEHTLRYTYIGFKTETVKMKVFANQTKDILLNEDSQKLAEVTVYSNSKAVDLIKPQMGVAKLSNETIKKVPVLFGETDIIKVLQLMPGVQSPSDCSTGFSVRGGGIDQNLVLLDEAPVYNVGHCMGFFSVFNNDAVRDVNLYKGDISAKYGGRLSSLLDVHMRDGNANKFGGKASIGLISSRLMLEGPIGSKVSYMLCGRRTYIDLFFPLLGDDIDGTKMYFYDLNGKINWTINRNNKIYFSAFTGSDVLGLSNDYNDMSFKFSNQTQTLRWNHIFSSKLFANLTLLNSKYNYINETSNNDDAVANYKWTSVLESQGLKVDLSWYPNPSNTIDFGAQGTYYTLNPGHVKPTSDNSIMSDYSLSETKAVEAALYLQNTQKLAKWMTLCYGLRFSQFTTMGKTTQKYYNDDHTLDYEKDFDAGEKIKSHNGLEPRATTSFILSPSMSLKAAYSRNYQYIQQAIYSISGSPFDIWFTASPTVKPQISDQFSAGLFKNFHDNAFEASAEFFYKNGKNTMDFKDHPQVMMNENMEGELRFGKSFAYGAELMFKYELKRWNGWISYTFSEAKYKIPEINDGKAYRSPMNHKHDVSVVTTYEMNKRVSVSANWIYYSGMPTTFPVAQYEVGGSIVPYYSRRNEDKFPDCHRMDLSVTLKGKDRPNKRWHGEWNFSLYNVYGRKNAWSIYFTYDEEKKQMQAKKYYLFTFVPSVSYNITF